MNIFPSWKYSKDAAVIVRSEAEQSALGPGWYDSPAYIPQVEPTPAPKDPEPLTDEAEAAVIEKTIEVLEVVEKSKRKGKNKGQ